MIVYIYIGGGVPRGVFGQAGSLCDPGDLGSVVAAIEQELRRPRGWAGVRPMTWYRATQALIPLYEEVWDGIRKG